MRTLEKIVLTGTALVTLAGSLIACNKKDYPVIPTEPTPIVTTMPTSTPTVTLVPLADLVFSNVKYTAGEWDKDYKDGKRAYRLEFDVSNSGNIGSGTFYVSAPGLEQKLKFDGIAPGKNLPVAFDLRLPSGKQSIDVVIEAENKISKKDGNNKHNLAIDVPEPPFKLVCDSCTDEHKGTFYNNALEDYRKVLGVYGINEKDARLKVIVEKNEDFSIGFYFKDKIGGNAWVGFDAFTTNRGKFRHETAHAINHTLFPTYHLWFDEGMAMYASGEIETFIKNGAKEKHYVKYKESPDYWKSDLGAVPGHAVGYVFFVGLIADHDLTPEQNRTALDLLKKKYSETGNELTKANIKKAYETALGKSLDPLFDLLTPGVKLLYGTDPAKAGTKGAEINKIIRSEFGIAN